MSDLLTLTTIEDQPLDLVRRHGTVVAEFGHRSQDSGNVSWLVDVGERLLVDFTSGALKVVDIDGYRRGPSVNDMGRMFGSTRYMAPEEFELGAVLDQRTTVFTLGRLAWHFGTRLSERAADFCGPPELAR